MLASNEKEETLYFFEDVFIITHISESGKYCKIYTLYAVYQYNNIVYISSRKRNRNKINILSDSRFFAFKVLFKVVFRLSTSYPKNAVRCFIDELLQPKEKKTSCGLCLTSSLKLVFSAKVVVSL